MISYALIANGQHNPYLATPLPEHMRYPISQHCQNGIDLDYSALVLGEKFIIDGSVYDDIMLSKNELFVPMKHSFRELSSSDLLQCVDYSKFFTDNKSKIMTMTDSLLENVEPWLNLEQLQWCSLKDELIDFQLNFGSPQMKIANTTNIGIESYLSRTDQYYNEQLRTDLNLLFERKKTIGEIDIEHIRGSLQYIVAQIVMSDLVSHMIKSPVLDWDDSKGLYDRLYKLRWESAEDDILLRKEANKLFNIVMPVLKPDNVDQVIKFVRSNKNVSSLRNTIMELISNGETVSPEWIAKYQQEIFVAELAIQKKSSIFNFLGMLVGLIPGISWIQSALLSGGTSVADKLLFHSKNKYEWYYALQGSK